MNIKYKNAELKDAREMLNIYNDSNTVFGYPPQDIIKTFEDMATQEKVFISTIDNSPAGFISYKDCKSHAFLSALYIRRNLQRQGLGSELLLNTENLIKEEFKTIVLKSLKPNPWVTTFYQDNGYKIITGEKLQNETENEIIKSYIPLKPWDVLMIKNLE